jgi:hypothetical protein
VERPHVALPREGRAAEDQADDVDREEAGAVRDVRAFHQGIAWVAQVAMFLTLGLLVFPGDLGEVALEGTVLALVLVFVSRPIGAALATFFTGFGLRERVILGWAGLRGAVPVVLATFPVIAGVEDGSEFFNVVFFAVLVSTVLQGATIETLSNRLGVVEPYRAAAPPASAGRMPVTSIRPWSDADGDPAYPSTIGGQKVVDHILTRRDSPGAVVRLEDGRYAATGALLLIGSRQRVQEAARRRLRLADSDAEAKWWREVIGACAL